MSWSKHFLFSSIWCIIFTIVSTQNPSSSTTQTTPSANNIPSTTSVPTTGAPNIGNLTTKPDQNFINSTDITEIEQINSTSTLKNSSTPVLTNNASTTQDLNPSVFPNTPLKLELALPARLQLEFVVRNGIIEIAIYINFTNWDWWDRNADSKKKSPNDTVLKTLLIGFEGEENNGLSSSMDILAIALNGDEEKDLQIRDAHWNRKDGILIPDSTQNYEQLSIDVGKNGSIFSIKLSRPWNTCDEFDFQFSNKPLRVFWLLDAMAEAEKSTGTPKLAQQTQETTTQISRDESITNLTLSSGENLTLSQSPPLTSSPSKAESNSKNKPNNTKPNPTDQNNATIGREVEILRSFDYSEFNGPFNVSMRELLNNFSFVVIKSCKNSASPTYRCTLKELQERNFTNSFFHISEGIPNRASAGTGPGGPRGGRKPNGNHADFCACDDILQNTTVVNALPSASGKRQGKSSRNDENKGGAESYSKNTYFPLMYSFLLYLISNF